MTTLALSINEISIRQDSSNRYCLNDLHKSAGGEDKHRPTYWLKNQQTIELQKEIEIDGIPSIVTKQGLGTFVVKELVYAYAMWISAKFHLAVIRAYDSLVTQPFGNSEQLESPTITKAQQGELFTRAKHIAGESGKIRAAIWSRFQNHFHLSSYKDLPGAQYEEALTYLDRLQHEYNNGVEMLYISNLELEALIQDRVKALPPPSPVKEGELLARIESLLESAPTEEAVIKKLMDKGFFIAPKDLMLTHFKKWVEGNKFCEGWRMM